MRDQVRTSPQVHPLLCVLVLAACGHAEAANKPAARPAKDGPAGAKQREHPVERIEDYMGDHFVVVTFSRDAVINGDLEALRDPLDALAGHGYTTVPPGGWQRWIAQIQEVAGLTAEATTLEVAASGVATIARACGGCHQASGGGPDFGSTVRERETAASDTLDARMLRHMWAADRMWEGLVGPSDEAWTAGAAALARAPAAAPVTDPPLPALFVNALLATRELADHAANATSLEQRANVYGLFLASCAGCHAYGAEFGF